MGKYYDEQTFLKGKSIQISSGKPIRPAYGSDRMVAELDNGVRKIYPDVTRMSEFEHFYQNHAQGWWLTFRACIVKAADLPLADRYDSFKKELKYPYSESIIAKAQALLEEIKESGKTVSGPGQRDVLSGMAKSLGEIIFTSGFYPSVRLAKLERES